MNLYTTIIRAICPKDGTLKNYSGQRVKGNTIEDAQRYCDTNGLGYYKVDALLVTDIPLMEDIPFIPDFENVVRWDVINQNRN